MMSTGKTCGRKAMRRTAASEMLEPLFQQVMGSAYRFSKSSVVEKTATKKTSVTWREEAVSPGSCLWLPDPAHPASAFVLNVPRTISNTS